MKHYRRNQADRSQSDTDLPNLAMRYLKRTHGRSSYSISSMNPSFLDTVPIGHLNVAPL